MCETVCTVEWIIVEFCMVFIVLICLYVRPHFKIKCVLYFILIRFVIFLLGRSLPRCRFVITTSCKLPITTTIHNSHETKQGSSMIHSASSIFSPVTYYSLMRLFELLN